MANKAKILAIFGNCFSKFFVDQFVQFLLVRKKNNVTKRNRMAVQEFIDLNLLR